MVPLNPATLSFPFGAVDQGKGKRHLLAGEMTLAENTRQVLEDEWRKRPGFDRLVCSSFTGGSHSGTPKEYALVAGSDMWRDGSDQVWSRESDGNVAYYRGKQQRAFPTHFPVTKQAGPLRKPIVVLAGGDLWTFSQEIGPDPFADWDSYSLVVMDATTKVVKYASSANTVTNVISSWAAAYDTTNGKIWLLYAGLDTNIRCLAFTVATPSVAPTATIYRTVGSMAFNTVDIKKLSNGEFFVVASSFVAGTPHSCWFEHSYLNTATGVAKTSPGAAGVPSSPLGTNPRCCSGIRILNYDGASGTAYYALWRTKAGAVNTVQLVLVEVNTTTLSISAGPTELGTLLTAQVTTPIVGVCSGYRAANGNRVVYGQTDTNETGKPRELSVTRYTYSGGLVAQVVAYQAVLLSDPFLQGSDYYFLTGYDDGQTVKAQRTYFLRDQDGEIVSVILSGEGAGAWHNAAGRDSGGGLYLHNTAFVNLPVNHVSNKWMLPVAAEDIANESTLTNVVELDFAETYAPPTVIGDVAIWNGPIPQVAGPRDDLHDLSPLLFPTNAPEFNLGSGAALGTFQVAYRYRFQDSSGAVYRSSPSATASAAFQTTGRSVTCQNLKHIGAGTPFLEIYGSVAGGTDLYLQLVAAMTTSDASIVVVSPERWTATGELLDTTGGALSQAPPPPCRCSALWRNRVHMSGCPSAAEIWSSKEMEVGRGPEFNEAIVTEWHEGTGAPELLQACDWNYLSIHKADAVGVLSGPGPDGRGSGGYIVLTLSGQKAARVGSAITGPLGCYFQNVQDGRMCLLPPGAPAINIGRGVESYRTTSVVAALHAESLQQIWFYLSDGKILVLDYAHPAPKDPYGRWSVYTGTGISTAAIGAAMSGSTPRHMESSSTVIFRSPGATFQDSTSGAAADVLQKVRLSKLQAAGYHGELMVDRLYFQGQHVGASTIRISVANDEGTTETFTRAGTASPLDYMVTPGAGTLRTKEFEVTIEETASSTEGFVFDSLAADLKFYGKYKVPKAADWITPG